MQKQAEPSVTAPPHVPSAAASSNFTPIPGYSNNEEYIQLPKELGRGAFGTVYEGYNANTKERVAIKIVNKKKVAEGWKEKARDQQMAEIKILYYDEKQTHPPERDYMLKLYQASESEEEFRLVLEVCNMNLDDYFKTIRTYNLATNYQYFFSNKKKNKQVLLMPVINEREIHFWVSQMTIGLQMLRKLNIVHRDIKPMNFLLQLKPNCTNNPPLFSDYILKIADLGFAKRINAFSMLNTYCGSPYYHAPELFRKDLMYSAKVDLWSIGVILIEMITGHRPKWGPKMTEASLLEQAQKLISHLTKFNVSYELKDLIRKLLCKEEERIEFHEFFAHAWIIGTRITRPLSKHQQHLQQVQQLANQKEEEKKKKQIVEQDSSVVKEYKPEEMATAIHHLASEDCNKKQVNVAAATVAVAAEKVEFAQVQQEEEEKVNAAVIESPPQRQQGNKKKSGNEQEQKKQEQEQQQHVRKRSLSNIKENYFDDGAAEEEEDSQQQAQQNHMTISYVILSDYVNVDKMTNVIEPISLILDENTQTFSTKFTIQEADLLHGPIVIELYTDSAEKAASSQQIGNSSNSSSSSVSASYWTQNYIQLSITTISGKEKQVKSEQFVCGNYFIHNMELQHEKIPMTVELTVQLTSTLVNNLLSYIRTRRHEPVAVKISVQQQE